MHWVKKPVGLKVTQQLFIFIYDIIEVKLVLKYSLFTNKPVSTNIFLNYEQNFEESIIHSKKCWVVLTQFWVKYGQTLNVGLKM